MGFEPTISAGERPQTYALDRAATGTGTGKNDNLFTNRMHKFFILVHYIPLHVSSTTVLTSEDNCINTASGIVTVFG